MLRPERESLSGEMEFTLLKMFAAFNLYGGDEGKLRAQVSVWADELEDFPLWCIKIAARWAVRGEDRLPTLAGFIKNVRLAMGNNTLERKRLLEKVLYA